MKRRLLIASAIIILLLLAFSGGMKLGQSQVYNQLTFGSQGEILVRLPYEGNDVYVKRYPDENVISILECGLDFPEELKAQISSRLSQVEGLEKYAWKSDELTLVKLDTARWEELIKQVLSAIFGGGGER